MPRKIYLEGELGQKFGSVRTIEADSFEDVLKCLSANFDDFKHYLADCYEKGIYFFWKVNGKDLTCPEELRLNFQEGDMVISPIPAGELSINPVKLIKKAFGTVGKVLLGGALTLLGFGLIAGGSLLLGTAATIVGQFLFSAGMYELLSEDPSTDNNDDTSYLFSGANQNINEGDPVPVCYGKLRIPGRQISFEIRNDKNVISNLAQQQTRAPWRWTP